MSMTRQHFEAIAGILKFNQADRSLCLELAIKFMDYNYNFDTEKFMEACGHGKKHYSVEPRTQSICGLC